MVFLNWKELPITWWGFSNFGYAMLMVMLVPGLLAFIFGWFAFRSRVTGVYLSIITQAMTYALMLAFFRNDMGFGGNNGLTDFKDILGFNIQAQGTRVALFVLTGLFLVAAVLVSKFVTSSAYGKVLVAIRDAESRTRFLGYRVERRRARDLGWRCPRGCARQFHEDMADRRCARVLAFWPWCLVHRCHPVPAERYYRDDQPMARGARRTGGLSRRAGGVSAMDVTHSLLYLDGVSVSFDGFRAINNLSLDLGRGEMRAIIGPNGAGKTTMMDIITGKTRPDSGDVLYDGGTDLTKLDEAAIAELGIGRKFQKPTVFESQTVEDNIILALKGPRSAFASMFGWRNRVPHREINRVLDVIGLAAHRHRQAADLSHGQKQWLEIGMLLAQDPKLLLVDEPVAGMTDAETETTAQLLKAIAEDHAVIVVEHDMAFVRALNCKVTCLHEGSVLAEGSIDAVSNNERVIEVYLGR